MRTLVLIPAFAALLATLGCTPDSGGTAPASGGAAAKNFIDSKNLPPADGYFRIPLLTNPPDLDPILVSDTTSDAIASKIFDTLVGYDGDVALVPELAAEMPKVSADGRVYSFTLRPGVKFHNGRTLVAADVKYSLERLASGTSKRDNIVKPIVGAAAAIQRGKAGGSTSIEGIRVVDDHRLEITLVEPYYTFLYLLAMVPAGIVPREAVEAAGEGFTRKPVGTGAFRLVEWIDNDSLRLDRFDEHFAGKAKIAGIKYRVIPEPLARRTEYMAGNLELCDVTQGVIPEWRDSNHSEDLLLWPVASLYYYGFNLEKAGSPFAGFGEKARKLREALNCALDREFICNRIVDGRYDPANGVVPPGLPGHEALRPRFERDIPRAKRLLVEAGHPNGVGLPVVELWFNPQGDNANIAQVVQQNFAEVGVRIELKQLDWAAFIKATDAGEPAFFRLAWQADYPDPENFLSFLFHSSNKGPNGNVTFYGRPEVDALLDRASGILDPNARLQVLNEAEEKIIADWPWLFIASIREALLVKPYVSNFKPMLLDDDAAGCTNVDWLNIDFSRGGTP